MPLGTLAAQLAHASAESFLRSRETWVVVLAVPDETSLLAIYERVQAAQLACVLIREPDLNNQATALGLEPVVDRGPARSVLGQLPLLRELAPTSLIDDGAVRCGACGSLAEHTMQGWFCTGSESNKKRWAPVAKCQERLSHAIPAKCNKKEPYSS